MLVVALVFCTKIWPCLQICMLPSSIVHKRNQEIKINEEKHTGTLHKLQKINLDGDFITLLDTLS